MSCLTCIGRISVKPFLSCTHIRLLAHLYVHSLSTNYPTPSSYLDATIQIKLVHLQYLCVASQPIAITVIINNFVLKFMLGSTTEDWSTHFDKLWLQQTNIIHVNDVTFYFQLQSHPIPSFMYTIKMSALVCCTNAMQYNQIKSILMHNYRFQ